MPKDFAPVIAKTVQKAAESFLEVERQVGRHGAPPAPRVVIVQFDNFDKAHGVGELSDREVGV
jgi:hypothetical protein